MTEKVYYFDNNATTRVAPEVLKVLVPMLTEHWANPSSAYRFAADAAKWIERARSQVANLINADPRELIFTSGGTESINTALHSAIALQSEKRRVITTAVEHSATLRYCEWLGKRGLRIDYLPVEGDGSLDLALLEKSIQPDTAMVSIMWANNETGLIFPVEEIAAICRKKGVLFHTDAVQAAGKICLDVQSAGVDFLSLSAHKLYAPKGIGLLWVRRQTKFQPYIRGGQQERGRRGGTENAAGIVAFGAAAELAGKNLARENSIVRQLRDRLESGILERIPGTERNGASSPRLPNTTNISFDALEAEALLIKLDQLGICATSGSACASGSLEPSHVLKAMGLSAPRARGSIRFSLGIDTTAEEVDYVLQHLPEAVGRSRSFSLDVPRNR